MWTRALNHEDKHQRRYQTLPIEEKESYKWLRSANGSQQCLSTGGARRVTHIGDRECDLYEEWATVPDANNHVLVRVRCTRRLLGQDNSLYAYLNQQLCEGTYSVEVFADPRIGRTARSAWLSVRTARSADSTTRQLKCSRLSSQCQSLCCGSQGSQPTYRTRTDPRRDC